MSFKDALTLTFGDAAENHVNMQKLGGLSDRGFTLADLEQIASHFPNWELVHLNDYIYPAVSQKNVAEDAYVLVIKNGVNELFKGANGQPVNYSLQLYEEQKGLEKDTKAFMYGRVVNKHARHNLCFGYESQDPDYEKGKGRIYAFSELPYLNGLLNRLYELTGLSGQDLYAEGNYYYDPKKTGIGYHGDAERRKVIGVRLGASIDLNYVWYYDGEKASDRIKMPTLEHGDIYIMSEKAVGNDWKKKKILTLRHAAGCEKYTAI